MHALEHRMVLLFRVAGENTDRPSTSCHISLGPITVMTAWEMAMSTGIH